MAIVGLHGAIGPPLGIQADRFVNSLSRLGDNDVLFAILDSSGGSAVDAWIIHDFVSKNLAPQHRSLVLITGECSSDAILIALAFEQILMRPGAYIRLEPVPLAERDLPGGDGIDSASDRSTCQMSGRGRARLDGQEQKVYRRRLP